MGMTAKNVTVEQALEAIEAAAGRFSGANVVLQVEDGVAASDRSIAGHLQVGDQTLPVRASLTNQASSRAVGRLASESQDDALQLLIAPYVGPGVAKVARQAGIGFVDLVGNAFIDAGTLHLSIEGRQPRRSREGDANLFSPKASRVLRVMLHAPERAWRQAELVESAVISRGYVSRIVNELLDIGLAEQSDRRISLVDPEALLDLWATNYSVRIEWQRWRLPVGVMEGMANRLAEKCAREDIPMAFTGLRAASLIAPWSSAWTTHLYAGAGVRELLQGIGATEVATGANLMVNSPPWDGGVFFDMPDIDAPPIVHPIQIYLDLWRMGDRGRQAAQVLREECLDF
jgi:hypothetical protein